MPVLEAVLFDLDGVLVDSIAAWEALLVDAIEHFGGRPLRPGEFLAVFGQSSAADCEVFLPGTTAAELDDFYGRHFARRSGLVRVGDGAAEALGACRERRLRRGVVTNAPAAIARAVLTAAALSPYLETVVGADEVARPKPAPDMVHEAASRLGVSVARSAVVGDSRYDVAAAKAAGAIAIAVGEVESADYRVGGLRELDALLTELSGG